MAADLGVDAVFVEAPESESELAAIAAAVPGITLVANMVEAGRTPLLTAEELGELGFDLIVSPLTGLFAMVRSLDETYRHLRREGSMRERLDQLVSFDAFTELVELDRHLARNPDIS